MPIEHAHRIAARITSVPRADTDLEPAIGIFQRWIQQDIFDELTLIDAVDYRHLTDRPQVLLICHQGHFALVKEQEQSEQLQLYYFAKRDEPATLQQRILASIAHAHRAAKLIEAELSGVTFDYDTTHIEFLDRLHAANSEQSIDQLQPTLSALYTDHNWTARRSAIGDVRAPLVMQLQK